MDWSENPGAGTKSGTCNTKASLITCTNCTGQGQEELQEKRVVTMSAIQAVARGFTLLTVSCSFLLTRICGFFVLSVGHDWDLGKKQCNPAFEDDLFSFKWQHGATASLATQCH